ncbi:MAG TPA: rhodanese-like domain-containing protein [Rhodospirillales bacterium]|nr:rhodanese-like domain-containing protein [Rhodospirillales bacterium]
MNQAYAGDISPKEAWALLAADARAALVDVRTPAEWTYVGIPDLTPLARKPVLVPWVDFPNMQPNERFVDEVGRALNPGAPVVLICRSGARSRAAAIALTAAGFGPCYNVVSGFEGDPDTLRHRGTVSGWKVDGLPWVQT